MRATTSGGLGGAVSAGRRRAGPSGSSLCAQNPAAAGNGGCRIRPTRRDPWGTRCGAPMRALSIVGRTIRCGALVLVSLLGGCAVTTAHVGVDPAAPGRTATIRAAGQAALFDLTTPSVHLDAVDDSDSADVYVVRPGTHRFRVRVCRGETRFEGDVALTVPTAGAYRLTAAASGRRFALSLRDATGAPVATGHVRGRGPTLLEGLAAVSRAFLLSPLR